MQGDGLNIVKIDPADALVKRKMLYSPVGAPVRLIGSCVTVFGVVWCVRLRVSLQQEIERSGGIGPL